MAKKLMAEQWTTFNEKVIPADASDIQRQEMKRAFYAGAWTIMFRVIENLSAEIETTEEDIKIMHDLHDELKEFAAMVKEGKA